MNYVFNMQNSTYGVNQRCIDAMRASGDTWKCIMAQYSYAHTTVPLFIMNSAWDSWQLMCEFTVAWDPIPSDERRAACAGLSGYQKCGKDFHDCTTTQIGQFNDYALTLLNTANSTSKFVAPGNGAFIHSCVSHVASQSGNDFTSFAINGVTFKDAFDSWWSDNKDMNLKPAGLHTHMPCTLNTNSPYACNPTCRQG